MVLASRIQAGVRIQAYRSVHGRVQSLFRSYTSAASDSRPLAPSTRVGLRVAVRECPRRRVPSAEEWRKLGKAVAGEQVHYEEPLVTLVVGQVPE